MPPVDVPILLLAAVLGVGIGVLSGMLGIGGGMIMVPLFRLGFAMEAIQATATSLFAIIPTSLAGLVKHIRARTCLPGLGFVAGLGGAVTCPVGVYVATKSSGWAIMLVTAAVIGVSAASMLHAALKQPLPPGVIAVEGQIEDPAEDMRVSPRMLALGGLAGLLAGLAAGYIGLGGGFILVPLFVSLLGIPMKKASGTSLIAVFILAIPGAFQQLMLGNVMVGMGLAVALGSIPGAILGANLVKRLPERVLRLVFGAMLLVVALLLAVNEVIH